MPKQDFDVNIKKIDNNFIIDVTSISFIFRFYALCLNDTGSFSDNYLNMLPGQKNKIIFTPSQDYVGNQNFKPDFVFNSIQGLS